MTDEQIAKYVAEFTRPLLKRIVDLERRVEALELYAPARVGFGTGDPE